ncbi:MAG: DNA methyltransferase, partial [Bacteroidetes bacterium]
MEEKRKCKILYFSLSDEMRREEKLEWFRDTKFEDIDFERIRPDEKGNWLNITDNDFDSLIPVCSKETKLGKGGHAIFGLYTSTIKTNRDEWVFDYDKNTLIQKIKFFIEKYNQQIESNLTHNNDLDYSIKWSRDLKNKLYKKRKIVFNENLIFKIPSRPFLKQFWYAEKILNDVLTENHYLISGNNFDLENVMINFSGVGMIKPPQFLVSRQIPDYSILEATQCLPLYRYEKGEKVENITDWALELFEKRYGSVEEGGLSIEDRDLSVGNTLPSTLHPRISKQDIFHYVYAVLHDPKYRTKYAQNLKRDFPKIPLYSDFWKWANAGKKLMDLHLNYEKIEERVLRVEDRGSSGVSRKENRENTTLNTLAPRSKLKANKELGEIYIDEQTTLTGVPPLAWEYKLGNRSA